MLVSLPKGMTSQQYSQRPDLWPSNKGVGTQQKKTSTGSPFATGQAQSQQSPYATSTPYQKNPAGDFAAYSPNTTVTQTPEQGSSPFSQAPQMPTSQTDGNWANYASPQRPSPFQATYGSPMGGQYEQPNFAQRDAFIQNINNQMTPYMTGQASGAPQFNFSQAWSQAGQMVNDGWQNPFTAVSQQSFPSQYQAPQPASVTLAPQQSGQTPAAREQSPSAGQPQYSPGLAATGGQSWTPIPGYGFDKNGNQVPIGKGGIYQAPPAQASVSQRPARSQSVAGMQQSSGGARWGLGSGQGGPNPGAVGYYDGPAPKPLAPPPKLSLEDRPLNPQARKSWDARYAAQNKTNSDGTQKSHYELNKDGAYKGMTEEEAMRYKFANDSRASAYNSDPAYRAMVDEKRRERMTPAMWAAEQGVIVENGVRRRDSNSYKQSDVDAQAQWLAQRGLTGIPDGTKLDEAKIYEDYLASKGKSIDSLMEERDRANAARQAALSAIPPSFREQQAAERARRAQSQEDAIRQFQQERGFDPRELIRNRGMMPGRTPIYI